MKQTISKENLKDSQTSNIVVSDEEIEKILNKVWKTQYTTDKRYRFLIKETANLISSKKDIQIDNLQNGITDLNEIIDKKDAEIEKLNKLLKGRNQIIGKKDAEWELRANKRVFEAKMLKDLEIKELKDVTNDIPKMLNYIKELELKLEHLSKNSEVKL